MKLDSPNIYIPPTGFAVIKTDSPNSKQCYQLHICFPDIKTCVPNAYRPQIAFTNINHSTERLPSSQTLFGCQNACTDRFKAKKNYVRVVGIHLTS